MFSVQFEGKYSITSLILGKRGWKGERVAGIKLKTMNSRVKVVGFVVLFFVLGDLC